LAGSISEFPGREYRSERFSSLLVVITLERELPQEIRLIRKKPKKSDLKTFNIDQFLIPH
jgi:hypothetical protein